MSAVDSMRVPLVTEPASPRPPSPIVAQHSTSLQKSLLYQFGICSVLLPPTFWLGVPKLGGYAFAFGFALFLLYDFYRGRRFEALALFIGFVPLIDLLRGTFMPFNTPVMLAVWLVVWMAYAPVGAKASWTPKMKYALAACILYWSLSFALTGDYARNLRTIEWALTASIVFMLSERRSYLKTALVGVGLSAITIGVTLLPFGNRLGMSGKVEGLQWGLGNPIVLGVPLALFLLFCIAERGKWVGLDDKPLWRVLFLVVAGCLLLFSTSRGSWFILLTGMIITGIFDLKARIQMLYAVAIFALLLMTLPLLNISRYANVQHYLEQTFSADTSIEKRTTGRVDQWRALPAILSDSPVWGVGPGGGRAASVIYAHKNIIFHSLYLQVAAETGIIGFPLLMLLLATILSRAWMHFRQFGEIVPLIGIISFIVMGLSVEGLDILGGTLLGVGLVGSNSSKLWIVKNSPECEEW